MNSTIVSKRAPNRIQKPRINRGASSSRKRLTETMSQALTEMMYIARAIERFPTGAVFPAIHAAY